MDLPLERDFTAKAEHVSFRVVQIHRRGEEQKRRLVSHSVWPVMAGGGLIWKFPTRAVAGLQPAQTPRTCCLVTLTVYQHDLCTLATIIPCNTY